MRAPKVYQWEEVPAQRIDALISRKVIAGEKGMLAQITLKKGGGVPLHHHPHEQFTYILHGRLKVVVDGQEHVLGPGDVLHIPGDLPHYGEALEDTLNFEVFIPVREEWLQH